MKSQFLTELDISLKHEDDKIYILDSPLEYYSESLDTKIVVPSTFNTDFASVPRVPVIYTMFGNRAHREAVIHDYLFRLDSEPKVTFTQANWVFLEAMKARGKSFFIRQFMYYGVCIGSYFCFHKRKVLDLL
ncbi:MAG: DUF1353 domain-containing protein [Gammaproteobacteria bacterium]|uniref:DUF1353 domain-containing protein n=1 Tax=viral metagenome TaxID=1070528 RepID=A0A6H1ZME7_9ZZZZ|nr:DUF1353 domain-containing protein [Gammaproteobacteria bacterium]